MPAPANNHMKLISKVAGGSVLVTALLTITILTLICATTLYVASQNANAGMQTASWQQALTGAESGVDAAIRALNTTSWANWRTVSTATLPTSEPSPSTIGTAANAGPTSSQYNLLPSNVANLSSLTMQGEGATNVSFWVTVDTAGMLASQDNNGKQWYRIRSTGQAAVAGPVRVSGNKLDDNLRNTIALRFNRKGGSKLGPSRTIEVILQPIATGTWPRGVTLKDSLSMSGAGVIDSYNSGGYPFSSDQNTVTYNGQTYVYGTYDLAKHQSHGDVGISNANGSDLRNTYVYGNLAYSTSGSAPKNTTNVTSLSTPFTPTVSPQSAPSWGGLTVTSYGGGGSNPPNSGAFNAGNANSPTYIKVNGDLTISSSGNPLHIIQHDTSAGNVINIWVTGKLTTSGSGYINQDPNRKVNWWVGGDITVSGNSYQNASGLASNVTIVGYGSNNKATISGSADFVGTMNVPGYDVTVSGGGSFDGALIADTLTISGGSGFHFDESLGSGGSSTIGNFAFASWFEDNSDPIRKALGQDGVYHPIIY
jgi:hypothetical protein